MLINNISYNTIWYNREVECVQIIDQTKLPFDLKILSLKTLHDILDAILNMKVRGAPLIGATAAFGVYLAYKETKNKKEFLSALEKIKN